MLFSGNLNESFNYEIVIWTENLCFVFFYIACSLNLLKWIVLNQRIRLYESFHSLKRFEQKKNVFVVAFCCLIFVVTIPVIVLCYLDAQCFLNDYEHKKK